MRDALAHGRAVSLRDAEAYKLRHTAGKAGPAKQPTDCSIRGINRRTKVTPKMLPFYL